MFLLGWGAQMTPGFVIGCAETIVNTISELDHFQSTLGCLFGSFLGTLGSLFLIFDGPGGRSENR